MNLENCELFSGLSSDYINELLKKTPHKIMHYKKNDFIYTHLNFSHELGVILKGNVFVYKVLYNGDRFLLNKLDRYSLLGASCIYGNTDIFPAEVQARRNTDVLFLSQDSLKELFLSEPLIMTHFLNFMSNKVFFLNNKIEMLALPSIKERLELLIDKKVYTLDNLNKISKTQLCYELSTSRSSLYRALNELYETSNS
ncbi:Crp/Fnr family transcriptional regulator [uncultured Clostridium sp.]|uniref:Crp/Fnr family transcriptional regulator n=1 Tax=uncultured Clostridium sp. TaxID=59620 RepID=UPI0025E910AC|nr:Crp/Fnr family transcriptional regulator [uncultured Clostridium sp.]